MKAEETNLFRQPRRLIHYIRNNISLFFYARLHILKHRDRLR